MHHTRGRGQPQCEDCGRRDPSSASSCPSWPSWLPSSWLPSSSPQSYLLQGFVTRPGPDIPNSGRPPKGLVVSKITFTFLAHSASSRSIPLSLRRIVLARYVEPSTPIFVQRLRQIATVYRSIARDFLKFFSRLSESRRPKRIALACCAVVDGEV